MPANGLAQLRFLNNKIGECVLVELLNERFSRILKQLVQLANASEHTGPVITVDDLVDFFQLSEDGTNIDVLVIAT